MSKNRYSYELPDHKVEHTTIGITHLLIDPQAQRSLSESRAKGIARAIVPSALGSLTISQRDNGDRYIVDGMHRRRAAQLAGIEVMEAEIHYGLTQQQEAVLFLIKNRESQAPNAADQYLVGLTAGVPVYVDLQGVLNQMGLSIGKNSSANTLCCTQGLLTGMRQYGAGVVLQALRVAEKIWGRNQRTWDGTLVCGLVELLGKHGESIDEERLVSQLAKGGTPDQWVGKAITYSAMLPVSASGANGRKMGFVLAAMAEYNKNLRIVSRRLV